MPVDLDRQRRVEAARDGVRAVRVEHAPVARLRALGVDLVQPPVQLPQWRRREVDDLGGRGGRGLRARHQTSWRSQA
jgi:hypothetical protein